MGSSLNFFFPHRYAIYDSWSLEPWSWDCGRGDCLGQKTDFRQALAVSPPITLQKLACPQVTYLRVSQPVEAEGSAHRIFITGLSFLKQRLGARGVSGRVSHESSWWLV